MNRWPILWGVAVILLIGGLSQAAESLNQSQPIKVTSGELLVDEPARIAKFSKSVVAKQVDLVIYAEHLTLEFTSEQTVYRLIAEDEVRIVRGAEVATAERADYEVEAQVITLTGSPEIRQGANSISGESMTIDLKNRRSMITSETGSRINATFQPPVEKNP